MAHRFRPSWPLLPPSTYLLTVVLWLFYLALGMGTPLLSLLFEARGLTIAQIGWASAAFNSAGLLANLLIGRWLDTAAGRRPFVAAGLLGLGLAGVGFYWATGLGLIFLFQALAGITVAVYTTSSQALIGDYTERSSGRGKVLAGYRMGGSLTFTLGAMATGPIAERFGLPVPILLAGGLWFAAGILSLFLPRPQRSLAPAPRASDRQAQGRADPHPVTRARPLPQEPDTGPKEFTRPLGPFLVAGFLWWAAFMGVSAIWPNYAARIGFSPTTIGNLHALAAFLEVPFMMVAGYLADRFGRLTLMSSGLFVYGGVCLLWAFLPMLGGFILAQIARGYAFATMEVTTTVYAVEAGGDTRRGKVVSYYQATGSLGRIAGTTGAGNLAQLLGFVPMLVTATGVSWLAGLLLLPASRKEKRKEPAVMG